LLAANSSTNLAVPSVESSEMIISQIQGNSEFISETIVRRLIILLSSLKQGIPTVIWVNAKSISNLDTYDLELA
jgi:hypothetical protein